MHDLQALGNRLKKNLKIRKMWAQKQGLDAYRLYDMDIPELRYIVDLYCDHAVIYDRRGQQDADDPDLDQRLLKVISEALALPTTNLHFKRRRRRQPGAEQYQKISASHQMLSVQEGPVRYLVNLEDYLDTGLFLDHRPLRQRLRTELLPQTRLLNLFCYTGSISVAAAFAGAVTTNVDLSNTYLAWARDNFRLNALDVANHQFIRSDALSFLETGPQREARFDVIFFDPPSRSKSKKMTQDFDVQRDHPSAIHQAMRFLANGGRMYFSTNRLRFVLASELKDDFLVEDITAQTIPEDFRNQDIHRCYAFSRRP